MKITFHIHFNTVWGQQLCLFGSIPELGSWEPALAKEMQYVGDGNWQLDLEVPSFRQSIEYRYFIREHEERMYEDWEKNHRLVFDGKTKHYILQDVWQVRPKDLAFYSSAFTKSLFAHGRTHQRNWVMANRQLEIRVYAPRLLKNQSVAITGNQACLGAWDPNKALPMGCNDFPEWQIRLDVSQIQFPLEFKFIVWDNEKRKLVCWEEGDNWVIQQPHQEENSTVVVAGLQLRDNQSHWKCAGTVIPVFSLRSEGSYGVGDFGDLRMLIEWAEKTGQRLIQVLPMNDTTITHTWVDSYPYSAISIYALHPMYLDLRQLDALQDPEQAAFFETKRQELNALPQIDYEAVTRYKMDYCRAYFAQAGQDLLASPEFKAFLQKNESWLVPYASYCYLRDKYGTTDFSQWEGYAQYSPSKIRELCRPSHEAWPAISCAYLLQYLLDKQFRAVSTFARNHGIVLKGDLPIGVDRNSVEAWTEPKFFNMNGQAGAPPDDFSVNGQNWLFPTYNWEAMEKDHFGWWKRRFSKLSDYFDCFRIDHILGFFRIWEVPTDYVQGLCGHFNPALPLSVQEIEWYGLHFNKARFTTPHIHVRFLPELFGDLADKVCDTYLAQSSSHHYVLKSFCNTQRKIEALFQGKEDEASVRIKQGLFTIANEVLFLIDPKRDDRFHPRIAASHSYIYQELTGAEKYAFDQLYWNFFYHRHNEFWKGQALKRLVPLVNGTEMLVCGEDLGMIPDTVPEVMNRLQIFSLEVERMPKTSHREFTDMYQLPYHAVCTTSTHDMTPLRGWWKEDPDKTQRYYNQVLQREGKAPEECTAELATQILFNHLKTNAMLVIIPLQDWFAIDDHIKYPNAEMERINVPAHSRHYWRYRMHLTLEQLMKADRFNSKIHYLIKDADR
ncbi:MAG: 4-alpha-glucanotransferase [Parabacteroides sp.]|nr:4-alpha-glucanotransferase [bacterium]MDY4103801.1 4-alpha-glucanotransferase [Parabacteroides sp.]